MSGVAVYEGLTAVVERVDNGEPLVRLDGELWQVMCSTHLKVGDQVKVVTTHGLRLEVQSEQGD